MPGSNLNVIGYTPGRESTMQTLKRKATARADRKKEGERQKARKRKEKKHTNTHTRISVYNSASSSPPPPLIFRQLPSLLVNSFNNLYHFQKTFCFS